MQSPRCFAFNAIDKGCVDEQLSPRANVDRVVSALCIRPNGAWKHA
jgi:hypothetical protein